MRIKRILFAMVGMCVVAGTVLAEDGMGLVTTSTGFSDFRWGQIRRIDVQNDAVVNTTSNLGYGCYPRFSPDGQKFIYLSNSNTLVMCDLNGSVEKTFSVESEGTLSWTDYGIWVGVNGKIIKYDLDGNKLSEYVGTSDNQVVQRGMVSKNEITGAGVNQNSWYAVIYNMRRNNTVRPSAGTDNCSACPSPNGLLITNNLYASNNGVHRTMRILDTLGNTVHTFLLQNITQFNSGYRWDMQTWSSNSNDWILMPVGQGSSVPSDNCSPCIYNISTQQKLCLKDNSGSNNHWQPFDYFSGFVPGNDPSLALSTISLTFSADSGSSNPPAKNVTATTPTGSLEGLSVSGAPSWLTVTPSATSGTPITIENSPDIAGLTVGQHNATIAVNTTNAGNSSYSVTITIAEYQAPKVLSTVSITPDRYTFAPGESFGFVPTCQDQDGGYITGSSLSWSTTSGGTINSIGVFTAEGQLNNGPHRVVLTASSGGVTLHDTARVMVSTRTIVHKKIDSGTGSPVAGWEDEDGYVSGGSAWSPSGTVSTTGVPGAAPAAVYQTLHNGNSHTYIVPALATGEYVLRIHYRDPATDVRTMNYTLNSVNILRDFSIGTLAGSANNALVLDFPLRIETVQPSPMTLECAATSGEVFEAGIEVIANKMMPVTLITPAGSEQYSVGQQIQIQWSADTEQMTQVLLEMSVDNGRNYFLMLADSSITPSDPDYGNLMWTIPDSLRDENGAVSTVGTQCMIRISNYWDILDGVHTSEVFSVNDGATVKQPSNSRAMFGSLLMRGRADGSVVLEGAPTHGTRVEVFSVNGQTTFSSTLKSCVTEIRPAPAGKDVRIVRITFPDGTTTTRMLPVRN